MNRLSHPTARHLRHIVFQYGRDWQRDLWMKHLEDAPRYEPDPKLNPCPAPDPWPDDAQGPMPGDLRVALLECLHLEAVNLLSQLGPGAIEDDAADAGNDYAYVHGLIEWLISWR